MKELKCEGCGAGEFYEEGGYRICKYCGRKYVITQDDRPAKYSNIHLNADVQRLLGEWDKNPTDADKYAKLILQIDPNNKRALEWYNEHNNSSGGGCYIATAVYGSYDCPQVWTLRRFRDNELAITFYGRAFIHVYYYISPKIVKAFGNKNWFNKAFKTKLDSFVAKLNAKGVEDSPYIDKPW